MGVSATTFFIVAPLILLSSILPSRYTRPQAAWFPGCARLLRAAAACSRSHVYELRQNKERRSDSLSCARNLRSEPCSSSVTLCFARVRPTALRAVTCSQSHSVSHTSPARSSSLHSAFRITNPGTHRWYEGSGTSARRFPCMYIPCRPA
jgi:hypothetical protein